MDEKDQSPLRERLKSENDLIEIIEDSIPKIPSPSGECKIIIDGKEYSFPVLKGTDGSKFLDLRTLYTQTNHLVFDPGFMATGLCCSSITLIDGEKGCLKYRGFLLEDLAVNCSYLEICYLLLYGELPSLNEMERFNIIVYFNSPPFSLL